MSKPKDRHFLEATLENIESTVDLAIDNEAVRAVPVVGTALKICKGINDMRSRALAAKIAKFVSDPALQSQKAKEKLRSGVAGSAEEAQKIGEALFLVLERMTDLDKPSLLAKIFVAYLDGMISSVELRRLAHAMDSAFTDDLLSLLNWEDTIHVSYGADWKQPLVGSGFTRVITGQRGGGDVYYELTDLGRLLKRAVEHVADMGGA